MTNEIEYDKYEVISVSVMGSVLERNNDGNVLDVKEFKGNFLSSAFNKTLSEIAADAVKQIEGGKIAKSE